MTNNEKNYKVFNIIWNTLRIVKTSMEPIRLQMNLRIERNTNNARLFWKIYLIEYDFLSRMLTDDPETGCFTQSFPDLLPHAFTLSLTLVRQKCFAGDVKMLLTLHSILFRSLGDPEKVARFGVLTDGWLTLFPHGHKLCCNLTLSLVGVYSTFLSDWCLQVDGRT